MSDVLDLDATHPPGAPRVSSVTLSLRVKPSVAAFVRDTAEKDRVAPGAWLLRLVEREMRDETLPADCRAWLTMQAAQLGYPGDWHRALLDVLRHLADRWPYGARISSESAQTLSEQLRLANGTIERLRDRNAGLRAALEAHEKP